MSDNLKIRNDMAISDIGKIVRYHDEYYSENHGFNHDFGRYVEGPLTELYHRNSPDERIWLLERNDELMGCIALARVSAGEAQLRWFFVDGSIRGKGYGQKLINLLVSFAVERRYSRIILWTVSFLDDARRLYEKNGFVRVEEHKSALWGREVVEEKYLRRLDI
jgi:GNAT superfamily N-acetyltransferase